MATVKRENGLEATVKIEREPVFIPETAALIDLSSSDDEESDRRKRNSSAELEERAKRRKSDNGGAYFALPLGFLDPLPLKERWPPEAIRPPLLPAPETVPAVTTARSTVCRQFWKAGDYEGAEVESASQSGGPNLCMLTDYYLFICCILCELICLRISGTLVEHMIFIMYNAVRDN